MALPTPDQIAQKWAANTASSTERVKQGVQAVTVAPGIAASRQKAAYAAGVQASQDKWASRVAAVPLSAWQDAVLTKGVPRIAQGAQAAQPKMQEFMTQLVPHIQAGLNTLPTRGTLDQNINRSTAWIRHMSNFKRR